jgi:hypothetical protein
MGVVRACRSGEAAPAAGLTPELLQRAPAVLFFVRASLRGSECLHTRPWVAAGSCSLRPVCSVCTVVRLCARGFPFARVLGVPGQGSRPMHVCVCCFEAACLLRRALALLQCRLERLM